MTADEKVVPLALLEEVAGKYEDIANSAFNLGHNTALVALSRLLVEDERAGIDASSPRILAHMETVSRSRPTLDEVRRG